MSTAKITKKLVETVTPVVPDRGQGRATFLYDTEVRGFGLKVTPGGRRVYILQYRVGGGRRSPARRYTIGQHGSPWTVDEARQEARRLLGLVAAGRDPASERTAVRDALTVKELCDLYLAEGVATKKASTLAVDRGRISRHIVPLLGAKRARDVGRGDVERFLRDVADGKTAADVKTGKRGRAIVTGGKGTAARTLGLLGGIFTFAVNRGLRGDNPVQGVRRYRGHKRDRFLSSTELARLGEALTAAEIDGESQTATAAVRLLVLTGARKSEILTAKWDYVDFERGYLRLPDSKTGAKTIPLGAAAAALLSALPRVEGNPYVLPGSTKGGHYVGLQKAWASIRERAKLPGLRLHDLRHSFASVGAAAGDSLILIGALLGHRNVATTQRYAHLSSDPIKAAADRIAGTIAATMSGEPGAVVTSIKGGSR